jgi:flagellar motor protein MotB
MMRTTLGWVAVMFVSVAFSTVGCGQKQKEQIEALQAQNNGLRADADELRSQLKDQQAQLLAQLDDSATKLAAAEKKLAETEDELAALKRRSTAPGTAAGRQGWEIGVAGDKITLGGDILFSSGKADLTRAGKAALARIVNDIKASYSGLPVRVYGYTDTDPIRKSKWQDNLELSAQRAMAVTRYLAGKGIKARSIEAIGMGEHHPVAGPKSRSRRVEIVVVKSK